MDQFVINLITLVKASQACSTTEPFRESFKQSVAQSFQIARARKQEERSRNQYRLAYWTKDRLNDTLTDSNI
eukprot:5797263-Alexandrium_andersonii.AAC.1